MYVNNTVSNTDLIHTLGYNLFVFNLGDGLISVIWVQELLHLFDNLNLQGCFLLLFKVRKQKKERKKSGKLMPLSTYFLNNMIQNQISSQCLSSLNDRTE